MQTSLHGIANAARRSKKKRFGSLYSFFNRVMLEKAYHSLNKKAAAGVDGVTYREYGKNLEANLLDLERRLKEKRYRAKLVRRVEIPKGNGKTRPLGIPALEDKLVQWVAREVLQALYEPLFFPFSFAYRPGRGARDAVEHLQGEIRHKYVWVVEADIRSFFDTINHEKLIGILQRRVNDEAFIRLIQKWLRAGVLSLDGTVTHFDAGTPQGSVISPILANIYLHYVLDEWFMRWVKPGCKGEAMLVRYADDFVAAFRFHRDAARFYRSLHQRFAKYGLMLAPEKTRKFMFNRFKKEESEQFEFLGFEFKWGVTRSGFDTVKLRTARSRLRKIAANFKQWCKENLNRRMPWVMGMVKTKLTGLRNYYGVVGNSASIKELHTIYKRTLYRWLNRRSQRRSYNLKTFGYLWRFYGVDSSRRMHNEGTQLHFLFQLS